MFRRTNVTEREYKDENGESVFRKGYDLRRQTYLWIRKEEF